MKKKENCRADLSKNKRRNQFFAGTEMKGDFPDFFLQGDLENQTTLQNQTVYYVEVGELG